MLVSQFDEDLTGQAYSGEPIAKRSDLHLGLERFATVAFDEASDFERRTNSRNRRPPGPCLRERKIAAWATSLSACANDGADNFTTSPRTRSGPLSTGSSLR